MKEKNVTAEKCRVCNGTEPEVVLCRLNGGNRQICRQCRASKRRIAYAKKQKTYKRKRNLRGLNVAAIEGLKPGFYSLVNYHTRKVSEAFIGIDESSVLFVHKSYIKRFLFNIEVAARLFSSHNLLVVPEETLVHNTDGEQLGLGCLENYSLEPYSEVLRYC